MDFLSANKGYISRTRGDNILNKNIKRLTIILLSILMPFSCNLGNDAEKTEGNGRQDEFVKAYTEEITVVDGWARSHEGSTNLVDAINKYYPDEAKLFIDTDYSEFEELINSESKKDLNHFDDISVFDMTPLKNEKYLHQMSFKQLKLMVENRDFFVRVELYYNFLTIFQFRDILEFPDRLPQTAYDRPRVKSRLYDILKNSDDPKAVEYADAMYTVAHALKEKIAESIVVGQIKGDMGPHDFDNFKEYIREYSAKWIPGVTVQMYDLQQRVSMLTGYQAQKHGYKPQNTMFTCDMKELQVNKMRVLWPAITDGI